MPQQKQFSADPGNPVEVEGMFETAKALVMDGWGATVVANPEKAYMVTNAPMAYVNLHLARQAV